jgi:flagellin-like hook-associated protein FlgL
MQIHSTNTSAAAAVFHSSKAQAAVESSINKLSSGSRLASSSDDAGGQAMAAQMNSLGKQVALVKHAIANSVSYLQTQDGALRRVGDILKRMDEIKTLQNDPIKSPQDRSLYDREFEALEDEIAKIREETFNGIRLFSPDKNMDSIEMDPFPLNAAAVEMFRPPLPSRPDPLEIVVVVDVSGSMDPYINAVKQGMQAVVNAVNASEAKSWGIKVVGYPAGGAPISGQNNPFITQKHPDPVTAVRSQIDNLLRDSFDPITRS